MLHTEWNAAVLDPDGPGPKKYILMQVSRHADEDGVARLDQEALDEIASDMRLSRQEVLAQLEEAIESRWVQRVPAELGVVRLRLAQPT